MTPREQALATISRREERERQVCRILLMEGGTPTRLHWIGNDLWLSVCPRPERKWSKAMGYVGTSCIIPPAKREATIAWFERVTGQRVERRHAG